MLFLNFRGALLVATLGLFNLASCLAAATPSSTDLHTFFGEVRAIDLAARTLTIQSGGKSFVFQITDQTKISSRNEYVRLDKIKRGQGATVLMRVGEGNKGIAVKIRFEHDASRAAALSLFSVKTSRGETISGIAVSNLVAYEPPDDIFNRGISYGARKLGLFLLAVKSDGTIARATALKSEGDNELDARAVKWLMKWRFLPNSVVEARIPVAISQGF